MNVISLTHPFVQDDTKENKNNNNLISWGDNGWNLLLLYDTNWCWQCKWQTLSSNAAKVVTCYASVLFLKTI